MRIGGFKDLTNKQIENATFILLQFLGEKQEIIEKESTKIAEKIVEENNESNSEIEKYKEILLSYRKGSRNCREGTI